MAQITGAYVTCIASNSTANGAFSTGTNTAVGDAIPGEDLYVLLDFRLQITSGTPTANTSIDIYRRSSDGIGPTNIPAIDYLHERVGAFILDNDATSYVYKYGVANPDPSDRYYALNNGNTTLTFSVSVRGRDYE